MKFTILLILFLSILTGPNDIRAQAQDPIKIGVISGLTGAGAKWSHFQNLGIELAQEELKTQGIDIELIYEDSQTEAKKALSAFQRLTTIRSVKAIIMNDFGFVMIPLLPLIQKTKVPLIALSLPQDRYCEQAPDYFFSLGSHGDNSIEAFERYFIKNPSTKKIALYIFDDPEWGAAYMKIWRELAKKYEVEIVETFLNNEWQPDFKSALTKTLLKKPDAIFLAHEPESFTKAIHQLGYKGQVVTANNIFEMLFDSPSGRPELNGFYMADPELSPDFVQRFVNRFNKYPILEAYSGYEALITISKALKIKDLPLNKAIRQISYKGVSGNIDLTNSKCSGNWNKWGLFQFNAAGLPVLVP